MRTHAFSFSPTPAHAPWMSGRAGRRRGFTRLELMAVLGVMGLLLMLTLPLVAHVRPQVESLFCVNNLRQIGRAFHLWAGEHGNENPWRVEYSQGGLKNPPGPIVLEGIGSFPPGMKVNPWFQFAFIHKELESPQRLVCPSDFDRKMAHSFTINDPEGGLFNLAYQNRAISYFIGLHAAPNQPRQPLSGDRHVRWQGLNSRCSAMLEITVAYVGTNLPPQGLGWARALHGQTGNILFEDGSVEQLSNTQLDRALLQSVSWETRGHFLVP